MARVYKCDRCGAYYDKPSKRIRYTNSTGSSTYGEYDLCDKCAEEFEQWLKEHQDEKLS